jgi:hypothetical protein
MQFAYVPLTATPPVSLLALPGQRAPEAIASRRRADQTTDLYAAAGGGLYYFAADRLTGGAEGVLVCESPLLDGVTDLFAFRSADGRAVVWGRNGDGDIFYTVALEEDQGTRDAWSAPLPIVRGVKEMAPYVNRQYDVNEFFAETADGRLTRAIKSPDTGMWSFREITLPPPSVTHPAEPISSYTTRVEVYQVVPPARGGGATVAGERPAPPTTEVTLSSASIVGVSVNHEYRTIGADPVPVTLDPTGALTIVEQVGSLTGSGLTLRVGATVETIDPMAKPLERLSRITADELRDPAKPASKLVAPAAVQANPEVLTQLADFNAKLAEAHASLRPGGATRGARALGRGAERWPPPVGASLTDAHVRGIWSHLVGSIRVHLGDMVAHIAHAGEAVVHTIVTGAKEVGEAIRQGAEHVIGFVKDTATRAWTIVTTIAGQAYHAVLDCVEHCIAAAQWLYNAIGAAVEDLIDFLKFLFEWDDIERTQRVMRNVVRRFLVHQLDDFENVRDAIDDGLDGAIKAIDKWAGIPDLKGAGPHATVPLGSTPDAEDHLKAREQSAHAPGAMLAHHLQGNIQDATEPPEGLEATHPAVPVRGPSVATRGGAGDESALEQLGDFLQGELEALTTMGSRFKDLADTLSGISMEKALRELVGIVGEFALKGVKNLADLLLGLAQTAGEAVVAILTTPIHIPVVSTILERLGIGRFSILDVICWVAAIPATIVYKLARGRPPFPKGETTERLASAEDWSGIRAALTAGDRTGRSRAPRPRDEGVPGDLKAALAFCGECVPAVLGVVATSLSFREVKSKILKVEALVPQRAWAKAVVWSVVGAGITLGIDNLLNIASRGPLEWMAYLVAAAQMVAQMIFAPMEGIGPLPEAVDALLAEAGLFLTVYSIVQLAVAKEEDAAKYVSKASEILAAVGSFLCFSALVAGEPDTALGFAVAFLVAGVVAAGGHMAASITAVAERQRGHPSRRAPAPA